MGAWLGLSDAMSAGRRDMRAGTLRPGGLGRAGRFLAARRRLTLPPTAHQ